MSLHKPKAKGRPYWICAYTMVDPQTGASRRVFRSTKTSDKKQALAIESGWLKAAWKARHGKLSVEAARAIIAEGVEAIYMAANAESLPSKTIKSWCTMWLDSKRLESGKTTHERYERIIQRFIDNLGAKANRDLATLHVTDIAKFRDAEAKDRAIATANLSLKVLRVCLRQAERQQLLDNNPAKNVDFLESTEESKRRPFDFDEIERILRVCNGEWRGLVLFGLYTGQRLGDLARLTWRAVNFDTGEIALTTQKTKRRMVLPLLKPLHDYLGSLPRRVRSVNAPIFPSASGHKRTASLSNQFREILVDAGLVEPRDYSTTTKGRNSAREASEISFHSLRHSTVTMLKAAGVSDFMAREIVGHESEAVSRQYTRLSTDDYRRAMATLPDVSATPTKAKNRERLSRFRNDSAS